MPNRLFFYSIVFSLFLHICLILYLSLNNFENFQKIIKKTEIIYQRIEPKKKPPQAQVKEVQMTSSQKPVERDIKILPKDLNEKSPAFEKIHDLTKLDAPIHLEKKEMPQIQPVDMKRKISVPLLESEKISNPQYLTYNQRVREKIRQRAYQYVGHPDFAAGEVYLTFSISKDGNLRDIKVIAEKTHANGYLQSIGIRSIKESHPFPPFPQDLNYPELTFNVIISFEVKE